MPSERTCFVISPIGESDSETRMAADAFFDLIAEPAVERFGFNVVRADKIASTGNITDEVLAYVREAELCIVDLTGHNPNVFYECGRRHETGRPCIQLIEASQDLPFDVRGIRTITYQFGDEHATRATVRELQHTISELKDAEFSTSSGASLSSIAEALNRVERRLLASESAQQTLGPAPGRTPEDIFQNPLRRIEDAIRSGNLAELAALLPQLEATGHPRTLQTASVLALNGVAAGANALRQVLGSDTGSLDVDAFRVAVTGLVQYHVTMDSEGEGLKFVQDAIENFLAKRDDVGDSRRAYLYNQVSMLQYGATEYGDGLVSLEQALALEPDDRSYWYNASVLYQKLKMAEKSCEAALKSVVGAETNDKDHLAHAVEVLAEAGRLEEAKEFVDRLSEVDPLRAAGLLRSL